MKVEKGLFGKRKEISRRGAGRKESLKRNEYDQSTLHTYMKLSNETHFFTIMYAIC
jgi:hypothetical protein